MGNYMLRFGKQECEIRVRDTGATWMAKAYLASNGEPILVNGVPLAMPGVDEQAALNRAITALEHEYPGMDSD